MSGCASHRLAELAVGLAVLLLLTLIVVLWTGSSGAVVERPANATGRPASLPSELLSPDTQGEFHFSVFFIYLRYL